MSVDKVNLKALAEAATGGPWVAAGPSFGSDSPQYCEEVLVDREGDEDDTYTVCEAPAGLRSESTADMEFIAAANPAAILALLAEIDQLKAENERNAKNAVEWEAASLHWMAGRDQLKAKLVYAYNRGYMAGHHDTVEGQFTDIHQSDMRTYHDDIVTEIAAEAE